MAKLLALFEHEQEHEIKLSRVAAGGPPVSTIVASGQQSFVILSIVLVLMLMLE